MIQWLLPSLRPTSLWSGVGPERSDYLCEDGRYLACPLKGLVRVETCVQCRWASDINLGSPTSTVRCNPSLREVIARSTEH